MTQAFKGLEGLCRLLILGAFLLLSASVLLQVFARTFLATAPVWTEELTRFCLIFIGALGAGMALRSGDSVLQVRRVLSFADRPTILEELWLPGGPFKGLTLDTLAQDQGPLYALFEAQFGVRMVRAEEKIKAVGATADVAEWLAVSPGEPVLMVERLAYTYNDVPMELRRAHYRTDTHHYRNDLS